MTEVHQIVNIGDLEKKIQKTSLDVTNVLNQVKEKQLNDIQIAELLKDIQSELRECEQFEFILEKRVFKD